MKLTRLRIQQLPGIDSEFTLAPLDSGVNLVTGPNAIGKSSLIRALRYLITEPDSSDPQALALEADFHNGQKWTVSRTGRGYEWRHDGAIAERPPLPDKTALNAYWLTMENLVQAGENDTKLVAQLAQALAGGYDLPALRSGVFELRPRVGHSEGNRLREALCEQRRIESVQRNLRQREASLPELEEGIETARQAGIYADRLAIALDLLAILSEGQKIRTALASFPAHMEKLHGNEFERLQKLENDWEDLQRRIENASQSYQDAEKDLENTGLAKASPEQAKLQAQRKALDETSHCQQQLSAKYEDRDKARAEETQALQSLGGGAEPSQLTPETIQWAETLAADLKDKQRQRDETSARLQNAGEAPDENQLTRYRLAIEALLDWLAAESSGHSNKAGAMVAASAGAIAAIASGFAQAWIAVAAAVIALGASVGSLLDRQNDAARQARQRFDKQQLDGPAEWERATVDKALEDLQQAFDSLRMQQQQALAARSDHERLQQQQRELEEKEEQKHELAAAVGFDPALTALGVDHFVRRVDAYQRARQQRQTAEQTINRLEGEIATALDSVRQFLWHWNVDSGATHAELDTAVGDLAERTRQAAQAAAKMDAQNTERKRLQNDSAKKAEEIATLYRAAGLEPGERRALAAGIDKLDAWKKQQQYLQENSVRESQSRQVLVEQPELLERVDNGDQEFLERASENARAEAGKLEALRDKRAQIYADTKSAGDNRKLEQASAAVDQASAALEDRLQEQLFAEAGNFLLDQVEREHRSEHKPEVLRDAGERFQRFTHHAWDVDLVDGHLKARDLQQNALRELTELSSGTRMQLLLAVRLAWTRRLENAREPLPLFLDEALTTADEKRFAAVAQSLESLACEEGRQVFYLSARRQELGLWEKVTGRRPHHIDLAALRQRQPAAEASYDLPSEQPLPSPAGKQPAQYAAALGVPSADPRQPAGELHLFHLLRDDLALLYALMRNWNVTTVGQFQSLLQSRSAAKAVPDRSQRAALAGRCHTASAWTDIWRRGRGQPVDRIALEASGAVSDKFIDSVTTLAEAKLGDAAALVEALKSKAVSGFRAQKIEELTEFFQHNGYIEPVEPLASEDRERQTLLTASDQAQPEDIRQTIRWLEAAAGNES